MYQMTIIIRSHVVLTPNCHRLTGKINPSQQSGWLTWPTDDQESGQLAFRPVAPGGGGVLYVFSFREVVVAKNTRWIHFMCENVQNEKSDSGIVFVIFRSHPPTASL